MNTSKRSAFRLAPLFALPLTALFVFGACINPGDVVIGTDEQPISCATNTDCPGNSPCVAGVCQQTTTGGDSGVDAGPSGCIYDAECMPGARCYAGVCVTVSSDAGSPIDSGSSIDSGGALDGGSGCAGFEVCDGLDNDCDGVVDDSAWCPAGSSCFNGVCLSGSTPCASNADCGPGQACVSGICKP